MPTPTRTDRNEFSAYLRNRTNAQVIGVWEKEKEAHRRVYTHLAELEAARRNIELPDFRARSNRTWDSG